MKRKLWVFGDSFAHRNDGWPGMVADALHAEIKNFAEPASSLFYSYRQLILHQKEIRKNDVVCFFITNRGRLYTGDKGTVQMPDQHQGRPPFIAGAPKMQQLVPLIKSSNVVDEEWLTDFYNACFNYYVYIQNDDFDLWMHTRLIKDLKEIQQQHQQFVTNLDLFDAQELSELTHWQFALVSNKIGRSLNKFHETYEEIQNTMINHLTMENNKKIADQVVKYLAKPNVPKMSPQSLEQIEFKNVLQYFQPYKR